MMGFNVGFVLIATFLTCFEVSRIDQIQLDLNKIKLIITENRKKNLFETFADPDENKISLLMCHQKMFPG